jgi:hypothetical protein
MQQHAEFDAIHALQLLNRVKYPTYKSNERVGGLEFLSHVFKIWSPSDDRMEFMLGSSLSI